MRTDLVLKILPIGHCNDIVSQPGEMELYITSTSESLSTVWAPILPRPLQWYGFSRVWIPWWSFIWHIYLKVGAQCEHWNSLFPCVDTLVLPVMSYRILQCPDLWSLWGHKALCFVHVVLFLFSARSLQLWFLAWGLPLIVLSVFWFSPEFSMLLACVLKI